VSSNLPRRTLGVAFVTRVLYSPLARQMARILALAACAGHVVQTRGLKTSSNSSILSLACAGLSLETFEDFVREYGKAYSPEEYGRRRELFESRASLIARHNCADEHPWMAQVNHMADWTEPELQALRGYRRAASPSSAGSAPLANLRATEGVELPETVSYGHLESIKRSRDQGQCGSCWAFAAETAMRARAELKGLPHKFAVGQIVACAPNPHECGGKGGCKGATAELAYEYALQAGLAQEDDAGRLEVGYPIGGGQPECPSDMAMSGSEGESSEVSTTADGHEQHVAGAMAASLRNGRNTGMVGWTKLPENRMEPIIRALMDSGPLTVSVAASRWWHYYEEGIMTGADCDENNVIGHAVVLFGIGKEDVEGTGQVKYWHLKNSWGSAWGEDGTIRIEMTANEEEQCGWDHKPGSGSGCVGGPEKVWVCGSCGILFETVMPRFH